MRPRTPRAALAGTAVTLVASVVVAGAAWAAPAKPRMLKPAQVPVVFGSAATHTFSKKPSSYVATIDLCTDAKGEPMAGAPAPTPQYASAVTMKPLKKDAFITVTERVFVYPSAEAAAAAHTTLSQAAGACAGSTSTPAGEDPKVTDAYANGSVVGAPHPAFWIQDKTRFDSKDALQDGSTLAYTVWSQAGDAVIQTEAYADGKQRMKPAETAAVQQLSQLLSAKWSPQ